MGEKLTITLTDRAPVTVVKDDWPIVASATDHDAQHESDATRHFKLIVRQHDDGRAIVYGIYTTIWRGDRDRRGGRLFDPASAASLERCIIDVADLLDFDPELAQRCIADLPAEELR